MRPEELSKRGSQTDLMALILRLDRMEVERWEVGAAFLPASLGYLLGTAVFGGLAGPSMARWRTAQTGLKVVGVSLAMVSLDGVSAVRRRRRRRS